MKETIMPVEVSRHLNYDSLTRKVGYKIDRSIDQSYGVIA